MHPTTHHKPPRRACTTENNCNTEPRTVGTLTPFRCLPPPRPQNQPTLNIPVQVSLLKSENTPAFYSDKSVSNSKPVRTRGPTHHGNSLTGKTINNFRYSWCLHQCFSGIRHNSLRHPGINSKTNINIYITYWNKLPVTILSLNKTHGVWPSLFCDVRRGLVVGYRRFGITYRSFLYGQASLVRLLDRLTRDW